MLDIAEIYCGNNKWCRSLTVKGKYPNVNFAHPLLRARNSGLMSGDASYMHDYAQHHRCEISFQAEDTIVDIGAHLGKFSIPLYLVHPELRVHAYEPDMHNYRCIVKSREYNGIDPYRYTIEQLGVYSRSGTVEFVVGGHSSIGTVRETELDLKYRILDTAEKAEVAVIPLAQVFADHSIDRCKILKMDCEGAEYEILYGASDDIIDMIQFLFIEIHPTKGRDPEDLIRHLQGKGFDLKGTSRNDGCWEFFGERRMGIS